MPENTQRLPNLNEPLFDQPIVITFNVGSATIKMAAYDTREHAHNEANDPLQTLQRQPLFDVNINLKTHESLWHHQPTGLTNWQAQGGLTEVAVSLFRALQQAFPQRQIVCVHRVVHGGLSYAEPVVINDAVMAKLVELSPICPLHQPPALSVVNALHQVDEHLIHIAAFDTAFHHNRPELWANYALPRSLRDQGVRCYGFHGLSYQAIMRRIRSYRPELADKRLIVAHLGSGCSITSIQAGNSIDSTFGFSGLDGVPMGTRVGQLDPAVVLYLVEQGWSLDDMNRCLYKESGLLGLSEISNDVADLLASDDDRAKFALAYFVAHAAKHIASLMVSLQGCDALIFTAGIGENSPVIRQRIVDRLGFLGFHVDEASNNATERHVTLTPIHAENSKQIFTIATDEQLELYLAYEAVTQKIALETRNFVNK